MRNLLIFISMLVLLGILIGVFTTQGGLPVRTKVTVFEGSVSLYSFDENGRRQLNRIVQAGESAEISTQRPLVPPGLFFKSLKTGFPKAVYAFIEAVKVWARDLPDDRLARFFTEEEFNVFLSEKLSQNTPFSNIQFSLADEGCSGQANLKIGFIDVVVTGTGRAMVDKENGQLYLEIDYIKVGIIDLPRFVLRELEEAFTQIFSRGDFPLKVLELEYQNRGILIYAIRRNQ